MITNNTTSASSVSSASSGTGASSAASSALSSAQMQDRFLTLLVAQLQNQDPMNPMDNAQMTSQMAQISTVTGLEKMNETIGGITNQFNSLQIMQGSGMIGRTILSQGDELGIVESEMLDDDGNTVTGRIGTGAFLLSDPSANVKITILSPSGQIIDRVDYGTANEGRNYFTWSPSDNYDGDMSGLRFRVEAMNDDAVVAATTLTPSTIVSSRVEGGRLSFELSNGETRNLEQIEAVY